jgi:hypothetical protein
MVSPYSGLGLTPVLVIQSVACNNTSLTQAATYSLHQACVDPTFWHVAGVLPLVAGGFVLTSTTVHAMRLWVMEAFSIIKRRK